MINRLGSKSVKRRNQHHKSSKSGGQQHRTSLDEELKASNPYTDLIVTANNFVATKEDAS